MESKTSFEKDSITSRIKIPTTLAGFIILLSGVLILFKTIFIPSPLENSTAYIILFVSLFLILLGTITVNRGEAIKI